MCVIVSALQLVSSSVVSDSGVANWQHVGAVAPVCALLFSPWWLHSGQRVCASKYVCVYNCFYILH